MAIRSLELRVRLLVHGMLRGLHRSPQHGFSVEFTEYRPYALGEDVRFLDWRLYGRSDRLYTKRFEDETNVRGYLLLDQSASMRYGSLAWTKADYARTLGATIAYFLNSQRDAVGLAVFDDQIREFLPARHRAGQLRRILVSLERPPEGKGSDLVRPLDEFLALARKSALVWFISDFLAPLDGIDRRLAWLRGRGHDVRLVQVVDPREEDFEFEQGGLFQDMESGRRLTLSPGAIRQRYVERFMAHRQTLANMVAKEGLRLRIVRTDESLVGVLSRLVTGRD